MERTEFARRLTRNALLWIAPVALVWLVATPVYNRFLAAAGEIVLHAAESPNASRLYVRDSHVLRIVRTDIGGGQNTLHETRLSDFHFDWILLGVLFLATPSIAPRRRAETLAWSVAALVLFHLLLVVFYVESVYANDLGDWSLRHYGALARNFWGLGKHLLDLPLKFALPFALWAVNFWPSIAEPPSSVRQPAKRR
jgi:hypothetical protein